MAPIASSLLRLNAIRVDSPGRTSGVVLLVFSVTVFVMALGVRYIGRR